MVVELVGFVGLIGLVGLLEFIGFFGLCVQFLQFDVGCWMFDVHLFHGFIGL